ncbi:hypothetical protein, partial [Staphylococcus aureus]
MTAPERDSSDKSPFRDEADDEVQFIETPKADQPKFLTPTRDTQMVSTTPTVPLWLSNSINKKRSLQPVASPVKDTVTR